MSGITRTANSPSSSGARPRSAPVSPTTERMPSRRKNPASSASTWLPIATCSVIQSTD
jgi:hypothetical protein